MFMPLLWSYLLKQYLRVLILCTCAFIAILFTMRLEEIARFATLGADVTSLLGFILHQIPYVLPIALPISCLISTTLLIQRLSQNHELTAMRSSGLALRDILAPILIAAAALTLFNFYIVSERATDSHLTAGMLKSQLRAVNPLLLGHNKHLMELKGFYCDTLGSSQLGEYASDIVLAMPNKSCNKLNLMVAKKMQSAPENFTGQQITFISGKEEKEPHNFDSLVLENIGNASILIEDFAQMVQKKVWTVNYDHLRLPLLLVRLEEDRNALKIAKEKEAPESEQKSIRRNLNRGYSELMRRLSVAMAVFTFTLMGAAFGISISRTRSSKGLFYTVGFSALYLIAYFSAKGMDHIFATASLLYFVPHILITFFSLWALWRVAKGME